MTMTIKSSCLLLATMFVALLQLACGGAQAPQSASMDAAAEEESGGSEAPQAEGMVDTMPVAISVNEEWRELISQDDSLSQNLELSEIDCTSARDLVSSICSLAERVCVIAEDTADGETEERCVDGRSRCERAQDRTSNRCP
ncbi:MAG: hypothetical protein ACI9KE_001250 [Polyangiales bacterium]|jgi:hypothetical protein